MNNVLIIGSGGMAVEYAKVLTALESPFKVIGRGERKCAALREIFPSINVYAGGVEHNQDQIGLAEAAIVAVNIPELFHITSLLLECGVKNILLEKPGALYLDQLNTLLSQGTKKDARIFIAYNRRFYTSTYLAKQIIEKDGGISSLHFEFTEWSHVIDPKLYDPRALQRWILSNSSHVIDLAFHLCGRPTSMHSISTGAAVPWHPSGSKFTGCGVTERHIPFSYHADWGAPGRWDVEILTPAHRLYFKPMERLSIQRLGEIEITELPHDYSLDIAYKPGLYKQVKAFLEHSEMNAVCTLQEHIQNFSHYEKIGSYHDKRTGDTL